MMKRGPIIVIGIVVIALVVTPFAIGMIVENGMREQLAIYDEQPSMSATVDSYERGFLSSYARLSFGLNNQDLAALDADPGLAAMANLRLPIVVEISHGPILLDGGFPLGTSAVRAYIDPDFELSVLARNVLGIPYIIEFRGRSGFGTGFRFDGDIPAFDGAFMEASYEFSGVDFSGSARGGHVAFEGLLENAALQGFDASMLLERLALSGDWQSRPEKIALGEFGMSLDRLILTNPLAGTAPIFAATDLSITSSVSENADGTLMELGGLYETGSLAIADELELSDAAMGLTLRNIDAEGANQFYRLADQLAGVDDPTVLLDTLMPVLDRVVAAGPELSLDPIRFSMPEGNFSATANVSLDPGALPTGSATDLMNMAFAMGAIGAEIELTATKALLQRVAGLAMQTQIAPGPADAPMSPDEIEALAEAQAGLTLIALTAQGVLIDDGENYTCTLSFANGQVLANGQPLPLFGF